jgi:hypothetical protein
MRFKDMPFEFDGELITSFGGARLLSFSDGKLVLKGGSKEDRAEFEKWISMFMPQAVHVER